MIGTGIGLGLAGYRFNPAGVLPVLDINFRDSKSFSSTIGPTASFSRASSGTYFDETGVLRTASTNVGRINHVHDGTGWVCKGGLIEEQRTNSQKWSEDLTNAVFIKSNCTVSVSGFFAPNGSSYANQITDNSTNDIHRLYSSNTATANQAISFSVFLKQGTARYAVVLNSDNNDWRSYCVVDLQTGTITKSGVASAATGASFISASISNCGNGWYRVSVSGTNQTSDTNYYSQIGISNSATPTGLPSYAGSGDYIYAWGLQQEIGSRFHTSYISNNGSGSTTRSADVMQITGSNFSGIWNATEGSIVLEQDFLNYAIPDADQRYFSISSGGEPHMTLHYDAGNSLYFERWNFGTTINLADVSSAFKLAYGFKTNSYAASLNGAAVVTSSSGTLPSTGFTGFDLGYQVGGAARSSHISRFRYYNTRLDNATLRALST